MGMMKMLRPMNGHLARKPGRNAKINSTLHYTLICVFIYRYYFMKIFKMVFGIRYHNGMNTLYYRTENSVKFVWAIGNSEQENLVLPFKSNFADI